MRTATALTVASVLLMGTIALAQSVTYDVDRSANFAGYRTYTWVRGTSVDDEINHRRIVGAVDAQMTARGYAKVDAAANPDVLVAYHASFDRDLQVTGFSSGFGGYRFGANRLGTARAEEILVGTLAVDLVDAHTRTIVWRAIASRDIDVTARPEQRETNIRKAVEKLFRHYPGRR